MSVGYNNSANRPEKKFRATDSHDEKCCNQPQKSKTDHIVKYENRGHRDTRNRLLNAAQIVPEHRRTVTTNKPPKASPQQSRRRNRRQKQFHG